MPSAARLTLAMNSDIGCNHKSISSIMHVHSHKPLRLRNKQAVQNLLSFKHTRITSQYPLVPTTKKNLSPPIPLQHLPPRLQHHLLPPPLQPLRPGRLITRPSRPLLLLALHRLLALVPNPALQPIPRDQIRLPARTRPRTTSRNARNWHRRLREDRLVARRRVIQPSACQDSLGGSGDVAAVAVQVPGYAAAVELREHGADLGYLRGVDAAVGAGRAAVVVVAAAGRGGWGFVEVPADGEEADQRDGEELRDVD